MARRRSRREKKKTDDVQAELAEAPAISPDVESALAAKLSQWTSDGFNVSSLEEMLKAKDAAVVKAVDDAEANIKAIGELKGLLSSMNITGLDSDAEALLVSMKDPTRMQDIQGGFETLKRKARARDMSSELDGITLPALKERVERLKANLTSDVSRMEEYETELADIRRIFKEQFFTESVAVEIEKEPAPKLQEAATKKPERPAEPMIVNDIFLIHKDGKFISHHTTRTTGREEQTEIFSDLRTVRNYLKSPKYMPRRLNVINLNQKKIVVLSGNYLVVMLTVTGDVNPWTDRIVGKVINLMEREDEPALRTFAGDPSSVKSAGKYMTALLYACVRLGKGGNGAPPQ
ncbi:MAG: hypothetical protein HZB92_05855 [Euryarchaeota archaeon]|nr:hypothetical protein [Euryarchaeota archaeon]